MKQDNVIANGLKMTELGPLPQEWKVVELGDVANVDWGNTALTKRLYKPTGYPAYSARGQDGYLDFYERDGEAVILSAIGARCGKCFYAQGKWTAIKNTIVIASGEDGGLNVKYFYFFGNNEKFWHRSGTGQPFIAIGKAKQQKIPLPPLPEQKKIASVLAAVHEAKEKTEGVTRAAKELKKSLMKYLFTYGPVPLEGAENVPLKETEIGLMPEEWEVARLGDVADFKNGVNFTRAQKGDLGILTIDVLNMYSEGLYVGPDNLYRVNKEVDEGYLLKNGDVLFVRSSLKREGVGWASLFGEAEEPVTFCGFIIRARLRRDDIAPRFLAWYFRTNTARRNLVASSGKVAITNINQGMLGRARMPVPSLAAQRQVADMLSAVDEKMEAEEKKRKALEELFKTLLNDLMTARIRVSDLEIE